ncbi:hypothetical protein Milano_059 [Agrobacterium phage Milano]|nr:hypothetical protein Milano_059 [Agrobacterium phage Milano]
MTREIWKNPINIYTMPESHIDVMVPADSEVLHVSRQFPQDDSLPQVWTIGTPSKPREPLRIHVFGTGVPIPAGLKLKHIGTEIFHRGQLVLHFFVEEKE